ncbi:MGMT family protein [Pseudenhygromyxa sp. WMMC2535]|uniref:MGMT family protein n=1 Tax=Pseudenhygromyxa sp. WMMC2535 TaxID=2712867 RepID=UPI0015529E35|nr:MGMT family protein [Pseudenhygromyxa sp. WMMC2535]
MSPEDPGARRAAILEALAGIPRGRVVAYGQLAALAGYPGCARQVGRILSQLPPGHDLPWQRVLGAGGRISLEGAAGRRQRRLLEAEGVEFRASGRVDLRRFGLFEGPG